MYLFRYQNEVFKSIEKVGRLAGQENPKWAAVNVFVKILKCISLNLKIYLLRLQNVFVQVPKTKSLKQKLADSPANKIQNGQLDMLQKVTKQKEFILNCTQLLCKSDFVKLTWLMSSRNYQMMTTRIAWKWKAKFRNWNYLKWGFMSRWQVWWRVHFNTSHPEMHGSQN